VARLRSPLIPEEVMQVKESVFIHRPPQDVFAHLAVRSNDASWMASVVESAWLDADAADAAEPIGVGRRGRMVMRLPGRRAQFIDEVTEYEPGGLEGLGGWRQQNSVANTSPAGAQTRTSSAALWAGRRTWSPPSPRRGGTWPRRREGPRMSASSTLTLSVRPARATLARARALISAEMSAAVTAALNRRATSIAVVATPQPMSSTRWSAVKSAKPTTSSVARRPPGE
jgi:hypothetical protein